ncbi:hypothetical protein LAZ67_15002061 [Cordylochernes scorpioides]|uniref:Uncharacterized protein n=1 Tax=Cordylochernes scorpioides TaxID=51811 RepID=A0ABY6LA59_9ARAC|nr:hypothetical protein LAZ67_15002061 [Cordylochernes scorpioides]
MSPGVNAVWRRDVTWCRLDPMKAVKVSSRHEVSTQEQIGSVEMMSSKFNCRPISEAESSKLAPRASRVAPIPQVGEWALASMPRMHEKDPMFIADSKVGRKDKSGTLLCQYAEARTTAWLPNRMRAVEMFESGELSGMAFRFDRITSPEEASQIKEELDAVLGGFSSSLKTVANWEMDFKGRRTNREDKQQ